MRAMETLKKRNIKLASSQIILIAYESLKQDSSLEFFASTVTVIYHAQVRTWRMWERVQKHISAAPAYADSHGPFVKMPLSRVQVAWIQAENVAAEAQKRKTPTWRRACSMALRNLWSLLPKHHQLVETHGEEAWVQWSGRQDISKSFQTFFESSKR